MFDYKDLKGYHKQAGQAELFAGRLVDSERNEKGVLVRIPFDMPYNDDLNGTNKVEVCGETDGTIHFRVATSCEVCKRGASLYELETGFGKKNICLECYT
ncbi:hypothetical protein FO526_30980, partial [Bacillus thuringiensis]|uniref:hypothetical protein n=1 Tax=Bacillus thuringiensis TaxID=1428 RepID=UPI00283C18F6